MPPNNNNNQIKVWNEDLVQALGARHQQAWQQQRQSQYMWRDGAKAIENVRKDIRLTKTGKIFNLPAPESKKFCKTVYEECVKIIKGEAPVWPPGFTPLSPHQIQQLQDTAVHPYIEKLGRESGGYAILLAFHFSGKDSLTIEQICTIGQSYCRDQMEANYHAGRMFGAWKAKDTLVRHGFVTEHKAGAKWTPRGFRSNGKSLYSISAEGKQAIQHIFQKWPDITRKTAPIVGGDGNDERGRVPKNAVASPISARTATRTPGRSATPKVAKSYEDAQGLREWINTAPVGSQKVFKVGKERRRYLHNQCDALQAEFPGLQLEHSSEHGTGSRRDLYITIRSKPSGTITFEGARTPTPSSRKRPPSTMRSSEGHLLGSTSATKKPRSAKQAAADAALARFGASQATAAKPSCSSVPIVTPVKSSSNATVVSHPVVNLLDTSDDEEDRKPAAKPRALDGTMSMGSSAKSQRPHNPYDYRQGDQCVMRTGTSPLTIVQVHCDGHVTVSLPQGGEQKLSVRDVQPYSATATLPNHASSDCTPIAPPATTQRVSKKSKAKSVLEANVVSLVDDDSEEENCASVASPGGNAHLVILIDDRERSRNHKPRELRIELQKEFSTGSLLAVSPAGGNSYATVEERKLQCGDFAFERRLGTESQRCSVVIERKRVGDLVQRSTYGDHWKQLSKMRDNYQHAIMLIEVDTKVACQFDAYGSQIDAYGSQKPCHHVIQNDADIFLFIGRAIFSSKRIKFIQTKDERSTFRSIGATALMAQASEKVTWDSPITPTSSTVEQNMLSDRLVQGGIHWKIAKEVAFQFGSEKALEYEFGRCSSLNAKKSLVEPILLNIGDTADVEGHARYWAEAVYFAFVSSKEVRSEKRQSYAKIKQVAGSLCDPALLLRNIYSEASPDIALSTALDTEIAGESTNRRIVAINVSHSLREVFETPTAKSFYELKVEEDNPWSLPMCQFVVSAGDARSDRLAVHIFEGSSVVDDVAAACARQNTGNYVVAAKCVAQTWQHRCHYETDTGHTRRVVLVRGLGPALVKAAKSASYKVETAVVCEMAFASMMIDHDVVVLQAVRKQQEETNLILRQLALACYHYQLLHHKD